MDTQLILLIIWVVSVLAVTVAFIWVAVRLGPKGRGGNRGNSSDVFSDEFRDKLRERGVVRFEHNLDQNSALLQQDLRRISDDVGEYIKQQAAEILKTEFADQNQSVAAAQQHMSEAFAKVDRAINDYHKNLTTQMTEELLAEKKRRLDRFEKNMADVVTHHVQQTLGSHMEVGDQVQYILSNLEENKTAILEDIKREF